MNDLSFVVVKTKRQLLFFAVFYFPVTDLTFESQLLALEEHAMCFNADILILRTASRVSPTVEFIPKELPTIVEIALGSQG